MLTLVNTMSSLRYHLPIRKSPKGMLPFWNSIIIVPSQILNNPNNDDLVDTANQSQDYTDNKQSVNWGIWVYDTWATRCKHLNKIYFWFRQVEKMNAIDSIVSITNYSNPNFALVATWWSCFMFLRNLFGQVMLKRQMLVFRFPVPVRVSDYSNQGCSLISGLGTPIYYSCWYKLMYC